MVTLPLWLIWLIAAQLLLTFCALGALLFGQHATAQMIAVMLQALHKDVNNIGTMIGEQYDADADFDDDRSNLSLF